MTEEIKPNNNLCLCGCNQVCENKFVFGHHQKGSNNNNWKGGKTNHKLGYIFIWNPDHPKSNKNGYVLKHRLIYEEFYNCCLLDGIDIDHINKDKTDNRIENLRPLPHSKHIELHQLEDLTGRNCKTCKSDKTRINEKGRPIWYGNEKDGFKCRNCYKKMMYYKNKNFLF